MTNFDTNLLKAPLSTDVLHDLENILSSPDYVTVRNPQHDFFDAKGNESVPYIEHVGIQTRNYNQKLHDYLIHIAEKHELEFWHVHKTDEIKYGVRPQLIYHAQHHEEPLAKALESNVNPKTLFNAAGILFIQDIEAYNHGN